MKDTVIKGDGTSRTLKAPASMPETFEEWRSQLLAGNATMDIGLNNDGCTVVGTAMSKANLLSDTTKEALELSQSDPTVNDALYALSQKTQPAELHVLVGSGIVVTISKGSKVLSATAGSDGWAVLYPAEFGEWTVKATLSGTQVTKTFDVNAIAVFYMAMASLEDLDWSVVSSVSEAGLASKLWNIGDTKTLTVNGVSYVSQIIGFDHDTKTAGGTAGITFQLQDMLATTYPMNSSNTNVNGWRGSVMRTSTMATLLSQLPTALQNAIKEVNKVSSVGNNSSGLETTADKLFLLSEIEIFGATAYSYAGEGKQYAYYAAGNSTVKKKSGSANTWGERSPRSGDTTGFCIVSSYGNANRGDASDSSGVSFGFCV